MIFLSFLNWIVLKTYINCIHKSMDHQFLGWSLWLSSSSLASGMDVFVLPVEVAWISAESPWWFPHVHSSVCSTHLFWVQPWPSYPEGYSTQKEVFPQKHQGM